MTTRERLIAVVLTGCIVLAVGAALGYFLVYSPLQEKKEAASKIQDEIDEIENKVFAVNSDRQKIAAVKRQSLPPDVNQAKSQYKLLLERLLQIAGITNYGMSEGKVLDSRSPITPELVLPNPASPGAVLKQPAYSRLEFSLDIKKANLWQITNFLEEFYSIDLLHQITYINLDRDNKASETRNGLNLKLNIEAIILDKAEERKTLMPVTSAVAAVGGAMAIEAVAYKPELVRTLAKASRTSVLSATNRDYSFLAYKDLFYGVLPPPNPPAPFALGRFDSVTLGREEKPVDVKVRLSGEGASTAKVTATATGSLVPEGDLKVDPKTFAITIPGVGNMETPESATSTVEVIATTADGSKTLKESFKIAIAKIPPPPETPKPTGPDIASAIKMIIFSGRSDGTAKAVIFDAANPFKFEINSDGKKVEVTRFWQATGKNWRKDLDYEHPTGVLAFADTFSTTKRTFKVVAFEEDAVILSEVAQIGAKPEAPKAPLGGGFGRPPAGGGFGRPPVVAKQGPASPLAAMVGNPPTAIPVPVLFRWTLGKSLAEIIQLKPDEAKAIMLRVAAEGPIVSTTVSTGN